MEKEKRKRDEWWQELPYALPPPSDPSASSHLTEYSSLYYLTLLRY